MLGSSSPLSRLPWVGPHCHPSSCLSATPWDKSKYGLSNSTNSGRLRGIGCGTKSSVLFFSLQCDFCDAVRIVFPCRARCISHQCWAGRSSAVCAGSFCARPLECANGRLDAVGTCTCRAGTVHKAVPAFGRAGVRSDCFGTSTQRTLTFCPLKSTAKSVEGFMTNEVCGLPWSRRTSPPLAAREPFLLLIRLCPLPLRRNVLKPAARFFLLASCWTVVVQNCREPSGSRRGRFDAAQVLTANLLVSGKSRGIRVKEPPAVQASKGTRKPEGKGRPAYQIRRSAEASGALREFG